LLLWRHVSDLANIVNTLSFAVHNSPDWRKSRRAIFHSTASFSNTKLAPLKTTGLIGWPLARPDGLVPQRRDWYGPELQPLPCRHIQGYSWRCDVHELPCELQLIRRFEDGGRRRSCHRLLVQSRVHRPRRGRVHGLPRWHIQIGDGIWCVHLLPCKLRLARRERCVDQVLLRPRVQALHRLSSRPLARRRDVHHKLWRDSEIYHHIPRNLVSSPHVHAE
jgi:hypothetical protein